MEEKGWLSAPTFKIIAIFTIIDVIAVFCAWLWANDIFLESRFFRLDRDRGFSEILQYVKTGIIITLLLNAFRSTRQEVIRAWLILFAVIFIDDAAGLHEELGEWLANTFPIPEVLGISPKAIAEITAFGLMEGLALLYVFIQTIIAKSEWRSVSIYLFIVLMPLIFSGVVLDAVGVRLLESIGEIISMSLLLAFVHARFKRYI